MKFLATIRKEGKPDEIREIEALSRFAVYEAVKNEGGLVTLLTEKKRVLPEWMTRANVSIGTGVSSDQLATFTKNLAGMLKAGLTLSRALGIIEKQSGSKRLTAIAADIEESVRKGSSLYEALGRHENVFPALYRAMVKAGEESGTLAQSLSITGLQMERANRLIKKVRGALIYPAIIIVAIVTVFILMMTFVVPTLTLTFEELKVELPLATRVIAALSSFMTEHFALMLGGIAVLIIGGYFFIRSKPGGALVLTTALHLPVIGELVRETFAARGARTLSSLLASGVPLLHALEITEEVLGANAFGRVLQDAQGRVKRGEALSASFTEASALFPIFLSDMLAVGEETGNLAEMLRQVAEFYEEDVEERTKDLSTIIEPVIMLVVGVGVGIFAVAMIAPIYSLSSAI